MDEATSERKKSTWKLRYVRWLRLGNWSLIPIYLFMVLIPVYYEATAEIPSIDHLHLTQGELIYKWTGKRGSLTGLKTSQGDIYFTCRLGLFSKRNDCIANFYELKRLVGKPAIVWWYEQPVYLFSSQRRLVRLEIGSEEKVGLQESIEMTKWAAGHAPWYAVGLFVFFVVVAVYSESIARRIERGQAHT